jgi:hypothetical protein
MEVDRRGELDDDSAFPVFCSPLLLRYPDSFRPAAEREANPNGGELRAFVLCYFTWKQCVSEEIDTRV